MTEGSHVLEQRLEETVELAMRIASGDLEARLAVSDEGDGIEAVITALNLLAEELQHERRSRRRAEELLQDELDAYEHAPALFCSVDGASLCVEKCNETLALLLGMPKAEILGRSVLDLHAPEYRDSAARVLASLTLGSSSAGDDAHLCTSAGESVVVSTSAKRVLGGDGRERFRIVWRDVTAERRLEAQLLQAQKLEAVGRLSGGVAHDFNNILSIITGAATLTEHLLTTHGLQSEEIGLIQEAVERGAALTNDLLAFSRQQVVKPSPTDVAVSIREVERMLGRIVGPQIQLLTHLEGDSLHVLIDPSQLSQVLINLAINARDAMIERGQLRIEASRIDFDGSAAGELGELEAGPYISITVSDNGTGMPPLVLSRAFEPFFTTKPPGSGSGLGLSMCYGIVRQAGGRITIDSAVGRGTLVRIYLPVSTQAPRATLPSVQPKAVRGRETVLVVEDEPAVCYVTRRILERGGYTVLVSANGLEALAVAERHSTQIALVVTDIMMPGMGGEQLGVELHRRHPHMRILYVSGYPSTAVTSNGALRTGVEFLAKPFPSQALLERVRRILDRPHPR
jgi:two-component system, cell cycle sensor histidine kinase and response regulator CckA